MVIYENIHRIITMENLVSINPTAIVYIYISICGVFENGIYTPFQWQFNIV